VKLLVNDYQNNLGAFAEWAVALRFEDLSDYTVSRASRVLFDMVGVMMAGSQESEMKELSKRLSVTSDQIATIFTYGYPQADYLRAAFHNATEAVFLEMDEHHRPTGHPGSHVIPSALAQAEMLNSSGQNFITAVVAGYDMAARLANGCMLRDFMHCHGHMGTVGAAVANAKLRGFNENQMRETIHIAASMPLFSSWEPCFEGATVRNTYTGVSAMLGIIAADLAESCFTGLHNGLEHTFGELIGSSFNTAMLSDKLGTPQIDTNMFKFHSCCGMNHPPLDALREAVLGYELDWREVDHVNMHVTERCLRLNRLPMPKQLSTKFSIPFAVATALYNGNSYPSSFRDEMAGNQEILDLASRVYLIPDNELTARWPEAGGAVAEVVLYDGRILRGEVRDPYGWYTRPSNDEDIINKFALMNSAYYNEAQVREIFAVCCQIPSYAAIRSLTTALRQTDNIL
jgi:2-methylcitrate dehydratase PrpD